ncbi:hypothetical protein GCM10027343_02700 [Noviherbaspirillum agri]
MAYAVLFILSFAVAAAFMALGAWHVFAFTILEMVAVALAFLHYARHATDHERIALMDDCLLVEQVLAGETRQVRLDPYWTRIALPRHARELIALEARGVKVEVGGFVTEARRRQFAQELRQELHSSRAPPAAG